MTNNYVNAYILKHTGLKYEHLRLKYIDLKPTQKQNKNSIEGCMPVPQLLNLN